MFTGIVQAVGRVVSTGEAGGVRRIEFDTGGLATGGWQTGHSVAVSGELEQRLKEERQELKEVKEQIKGYKSRLHQTKRRERNVVQALDLTDPDNPKQVWSYVKKTDRDESAVPRACCDTVNRGGSYADGKFVYGTLDGFVIALDGQTGKEVWVVKWAYPEKGETITPAPLIADNKVFIAPSFTWRPSACGREGCAKAEAAESRAADTSRVRPGVR